MKKEIPSSSLTRAGVMPLPAARRCSAFQNRPILNDFHGFPLWHHKSHVFARRKAQNVRLDQNADNQMDVTGQFRKMKRKTPLKFSHFLYASTPRNKTPVPSYPFGDQS
jgi:hypothetical protein